MHFRILSCLLGALVFALPCLAQDDGKKRPERFDDGRVFCTDIVGAQTIGLMMNRARSPEQTRLAEEAEVARGRCQAATPEAPLLLIYWAAYRGTTDNPFTYLEFRVVPASVAREGGFSFEEAALLPQIFYVLDGRGPGE